MRQGFSPLSRRLGFVRVDFHDETAYTLRLSELERLDQAFDEGAVWFAGDDNAGAEVRFRLDDVKGRIAYTPQSIARAIDALEECDQEDRERAQEEKARGILE